MPSVSREIVARMPKVLLHDHLDGGLRPETVIDLAKKQGFELPTYEAEPLGEWFLRGANRGSLSEYLEGFALTCGVLQTRDALYRAAYEALEDLAKDGVVYAEQRFAPQFHQALGLNVESVIDAVLCGFTDAGRDHRIRWGLILCGMRGSPPEISLGTAEAAIQFRDRGCVGFDLAGDEFGHPPKDHLKAFQLCKRENFNITIHAGEAFGPPSIWQALQFCGAHRIGHGTRIIEDLVASEGRVLKMGQLSGYILDHRVPLEVCLTSNVQTGAVKDLESHPFALLLKYNFRVSINTDNRLMSGVSATDEYALASKLYDIELDGLEKLVVNGIKSAFIPYDQRCDVIYGVIKPGFDAIRADLGLPPRGYPTRSGAHH